jgi:hypothetical protein
VLPKDSIRVNCIDPAVFSLCSFYNTCQSGEKVTAAFFGKGAFRGLASGDYGEAADRSDRLDHAAAGAGPCRARGAASHYSRLRRARQPPLHRILHRLHPQPELEGQTTFGSSLAADLMLIGVFAVVDVVIPFDDDFALLA